MQQRQARFLFFLTGFIFSLFVTSLLIPGIWLLHHCSAIVPLPEDSSGNSIWPKEPVVADKMDEIGLPAVVADETCEKPLKSRYIWKGKNDDIRENIVQEKQALTKMTMQPFP